MKEKRLLALFNRICLVVMLVVMPLLASDAEAAGKIRLRCGTNPVGSVYYVIGSAMSAVIGKYTSIEIENFPQGNMVALPMFTSGECDLALSGADETSAAYLGMGPYKKITRGKGIDIRLLMLGCRAPCGLVVADDLGIKKTKDLKGKRVVLNYGTHYGLCVGSKAALIGGGLSEEDVIVMKANNIPDGCRLVMERKADACYGAVGVPVFKELEVARGARMLGIKNTPESWKKIHKIFHGYFPMEVKPGPAVEVKEPISMVGRNWTMVCRANLSDAIAYEITKTVWEHDTDLAPYHPRLKDWTKDRFVSPYAPTPYHPGAIKFYNEVGTWTEKMEQLQKKLLVKKR